MGRALCKLWIPHTLIVILVYCKSMQAWTQWIRSIFAFRRSMVLQWRHLLTTTKRRIQRGGFNYAKADREHVATLSCVQFVSTVMVSCCVLQVYGTAWLMSLARRSFVQSTRRLTCIECWLIRSAQTMNIIAYFVCTLGEAAWCRGQLVRRMMKPVPYRRKTHIVDDRYLFSSRF